jgi:hypothetical protein
MVKRGENVVANVVLRRTPDNRWELREFAGSLPWMIEGVDRVNSAKSIELDDEEEKDQPVYVASCRCSPRHRA